MNKFILSTLGVLLASTYVYAAPPETLTVEKALDVINKHHPILDSDEGYWVLSTSLQKSGYQFNAEKALAGLAHEGVTITKSDMSGHLRTWYMISWGVAQEDHYEMLFTRQLGKEKK